MNRFTEARVPMQFAGAFARTGLRVTLFLMWFFAITGSSCAQGLEPITTPEDRDVISSEQTVSVAPAARDVDVSRRIRDILQATGWYDGLSVRSNDGIVFLDGSASTEKRQEWAGNLASKTDGVFAVVNRIKLRPDLTFSLKPAANEIEALVRQTLRALPLIALAILILPLAWYLAGRMSLLVRWLLRRRVPSPFLRNVLARAAALPVFLTGLYIVLQVAGLTQLALSLIGGAGVIGIVVGFAFRDIAENFLASVLLSFRQPFERGDFIDVGGCQGVVHSMNTRSTVLVSVEGNHIQIPNAKVFKSTIENYSAVPERRDSFQVGVGYDGSIARVQELIEGVLCEKSEVQQNPEPMILVENLGASTVNIAIYYWYNGEEVSGLKLKSALIRTVKKTLIEHGVSMPGETREIIFPAGIPAPDRAPSSSAARALAADQEPESSVAEEDLSNETADLNDQMEKAIEGSDEGDLLQG